MTWVAVIFFLGVLIPASWYIITRVIETANLYNKGNIPSI